MANFNITEVWRITKKLHVYRRTVMNKCYEVYKNYSAIPLTEWSGHTRKRFHENMFGTDDHSGDVGMMLNVCKALNDLLFSYACYVSDIYNEDTEGYDTTNHTHFIDDTVIVQKETLQISYVDIDGSKVHTPADNFESFNTLMKNSISSIEANAGHFNQELRELKQLGIYDKSTDMIQEQTQILLNKCYDFKAILNSLIEQNEILANRAQASFNKSVSEQEEIVARMQSANGSTSYTDFE